MAAKQAIRFDARRDGRERLDVAARLYLHDCSRSAVKVVDCTADGFCVRSCEPLSPAGTVVALELPQIGVAHARVIWSGNGELGAKFMRPIDVSRTGWFQRVEQTDPRSAHP